MLKLSNEEFIEFIESFNDFLLPVSEISNNCREISLINNDFKMHSLDNIVLNMEYSNGQYPKATDGIFYQNKDGKMVLYLIEFKFSNLDNSNKFIIQKLLDKLNTESEENNENNFDENFYQEFKRIYLEYEDKNLINLMFNIIESTNEKNSENNLDKKFYQDFKKICYTYEDKILTNIIFKIIESVSVTIPEVYEEYCKKNNIPIKDIREYLRNINKKFVIFSNDGRNKSKLRSHEENNFLNIHLEKLVRGKIIDDYQIYSSNEFNMFLTYNKIL